MTTSLTNDIRASGLTTDDATLKAALAEANLPTLQLVLAQMTGDDRWLKGAFKPTRTVATDDNDSAGLDEARQAEIRRAAFDALASWRAGDLELTPPEDDQIVCALSASLGEEVPPEYATTMAEEAGFRPRGEVGWSNGRPVAAERLDVLVIGAGSSGVAAAITLERLGIPFTVVERAEAVGGVWQANKYPGAGVDTPTNLYSFSFAPNRSWSRYYAKQSEILEYLQRTADSFGITQKIRFGTEVTHAAWDDQKQCWHVDVRTRDGDAERLTATAVISCVGILTRPKIPALPGMEDFEGPMFHSSKWPTDLDVTGKRVAVIGTGATAMQIVPAIADAAAKVLVFQRSPQWIVPNPNYLRVMTPGTRLLMEQVPFYASFYRVRLIWMFQDKLLATLRRDPDWPHQDRSINAINEKHRRFVTRYIDEQLGDRTDLREKVLPRYPVYGKRILMDNNWYQTIKRDDVELITEGVHAFDAHHVLSGDGSAHEADVAVLATGFHANRMLWPMEIVGQSGDSLRSHWGEEDASAYLGISVPDFPNFFLVGGPNTALGHGGSAIYVNECAIAYIAQVLVRMAEEGIGAVEVRRDVAEEYNKRVDAEHEQLIWTHPGMTNWYRNAAGRVTATTPWRGVDYWAMTRTPDMDDFHVTERIDS